jgi:hypothetical protein
VRHLYRYLEENGITYQEYLASEHWKDLRRRFWASKLHNRTCFVCGKGNVPLDVHHNSYRKMGREPLWHLCLLCRDCHTTTHKFLKTRQKGCLWGAARALKNMTRGKHAGLHPKVLQSIENRRKSRNR